MKKLVMRYKVSLFLLALILFLLYTNYDIGKKALFNTASNIKQMLLLLPPVFILLGLLEVWIPRETMMHYMGEESGIKGVILSFIIGSLTSGPLYAAFPVTAVFMKKGVKFSNILIFLGAWSTTKIPMLLFEGSNLGWAFATTRLLVDIPGIIIMSKLLSSLLTSKEITDIYENAQRLT